MKKIVALLIVVCLVLSLCGCGKKTEIIGTITVFNYGDYIDRDMLDLFTEETGIAVKYEEALTPEEMYTKYKAGAINYDLVCSTDYMIQKLIALKLVMLLFRKMTILQLLTKIWKKQKLTQKKF